MALLNQGNFYTKMDKHYIYLILLKIILAFKDHIPNYTLYQVTAFNCRERALLYWHYIKNDALVFLNGVTNKATHPMDIVAHECCVQAFEETLHKHDIQHSIIKSDFLRDELNMNVMSQMKLNQSFNPLYSFLSINYMQICIEDMILKYSSLSKHIIGATYEKRELVVLKISTSHEYKPAAFVLGGEEGRDWQSPAIILSFLNNLLQYPEKWIKLTDMYDLYFLPLLNPDGYHYSMNEDRFWLKNRRKSVKQNFCLSFANQEAIGVNIDRNWFEQSEKTLYGQSGKGKDQCNSVFLGENYLSEEETRSLSIFLNKIALNLMSFICIKGFSNLITLPYSDNLQYANNHAIMMDILHAASEYVQEKFNVTLHCGNTGTYFYNYSGNSADWVKKNLNIPVVYTMYLKAEDSLIPRVKHIEPIAQQFMWIFNETMIIANDIYRPLFNKQMRFNGVLNQIFIFVLVTKLI